MNIVILQWPGRLIYCKCIEVARWHIEATRLAIFLFDRLTGKFPAGNFCAMRPLLHVTNIVSGEAQFFTALLWVKYGLRKRWLLHS